MAKEIYALQHDLLKLCDNFGGKKNEEGKPINIHYCPEELQRIDSDLYERLKKTELWPSLRHHCNFGFRRAHGKNKCYDYSQRGYSVSIEDLFLSLADARASAISRKLRIGVKNQGGYFYKTIRIWKEGKRDQPTEKPRFDDIVERLSRGDKPEAVYEDFHEKMKDRAEDSYRFPFSSLHLHNLLVERWFRFFLQNKNYFDAPSGTITTSYQARKWLSGITTKKTFQNDARIRKPIIFCRFKIKVNENLARINDVTLIKGVKKIVDELGSGKLSYAQELYKLGDELVLVRAFDKYDFDNLNESDKAIEQARREIAAEITDYLGNRTNYEIEANLAATFLQNRKFLNNFDKLFGPFQFIFGPALPDEIRPDEKMLPEARYAILCELCQKAKAVKAFRKFLDEDEQVVEHLCAGCYDIRTYQNEEGQRQTKSLGSLIGRWEREYENKSESFNGKSKPGDYLCYMKIDLDYQKLLKILQDRFLSEGFYPKVKLLEEEDLGFSVLFEFLEDYQAFLKAVKNRLDETYDPDNDVFELLPNFFGFRLHEPTEVKFMLSVLLEKYLAAFPKLLEYAPSIVVSLTISRFKYPFFEAWRYLNQPKSAPMNIYWVGHFSETLSFKNYSALTELNFQDQRLSTFLHNLSEIESHSGLRTLVEMEIWNRRKEFSEIYEGIRPENRKFTTSQLLNWYRLGEYRIENDELTRKSYDE